MIETTTLATRLGVTAQQIAAWRKAGMPARGSGKRARYDPEAVAAWLVSQGIAERAPARPPRLVPSVSAVAAALGVSERMVFYWKNAGMPCEASGQYDLDKIEAWREGGGDELRDARQRAQTRLAEARAAREELELAVRRRELIDAGQALRFWGQAIAAARAVLEDLPDALADELPQDTTPAIRGAHLTRARERVKTALTMIADAAEGLRPSDGAGDE